MNAASLKQNKWMRRAVAALGVLLALWLVAWLAVPPIAKSQLQKIASQKLGRQVTVGKIDFKPWTLELTLNDLRIATADGSKPQVVVKRIYADGELQSILRLAPVIDAVRVEAPAIALTRLPDGHYDIDDILARLAPAPDAPPAKGEPPKFAIYNIAISDGAFDFVDDTVKRTHTLREFVLNVPFLSNLDSKREIKTEPKLGFVLNGSRFDSNAASTPFADNRKTDAHLKFDGLDLVPYLGYVPGGLPVALKAGKLDADLTIGFEQAAAIGLKISGSIGLREVKLDDAKGRDLLGFDALKIGLADVRPLERVVHLGEIALADPHMVVARDASGKIDLLSTDRATGATGKVATVPTQAPEAAGAKPAEPPAWQLQVDRLAISGGEIGWRDQSTAPAAAVDMKQLAVEVKDFRWPMDKPATLEGSTSIGGAPLKFKGEGTDKAARLQTELTGLPLSLAEPYLAQSLSPTIDGKLSGKVDVEWAKPDLKLMAHTVSVDGLALTQDKTAVASVGRFEIADAQVDMSQHTLAIGTLSANSPKVRVERDKDKHWMYERWFRAPPGGSQAGAPETNAAAPKDEETADKAVKGGRGAKRGEPATDPAARPWALTIGSVAVENGALSYADNASATPVAVEVSALSLHAQKIAPDTGTVSPLKLSGRIGSGTRADPGRFEYDGNLVLKPIAAEGRLLVGGFPAHAFKAYYADALNIDIRRAYANYRGTVKVAMAPAGLSAHLSGDTSLEDFRANSVVLTQAPGLSSDNKLLSWKALGLRGLQVDMKPGAPLTVDVRETTLSDFFARIIIDPIGRLNLLYLVKRPEAARAAEEAAAAREVTSKRSLGGTNITTEKPAKPATSAAAKPATSGAAEPPPAELMVGGGPAAPAPTPAAAPAADTASSGPAPVITFGPMNLINGQIDFSDLFIKPNYSADLTELNGKLSGFSSKRVGDQPALADLELHGKAQQTASLEITGKLNPLVKPLELDITARMHDLDLPPLSPYTIRFAGHGIERGKLSMDVNYKIAPDGSLTAANKLVLNQLQFGEQVEGAPASLPVKLAVALLADRNGVIDVDLPLRGSINDPQFSIGPLILKAIVNLIVKAVTAPFSLLTGGLGGGSGESSAIVFAPGSAELSPEATQNLDKVAKALADRPGLQMTVVGTASLEQEREAYQRQRLRALALAEKRRLALRANQPVADVKPVTDAEYPDLLTSVYKRADIKKPRNMVGLTKDLPVKDMEDLLMQSVNVDEESMRQLAVDRGAAVRDYLLAQKLPSERLFLGAVSTKPQGKDWKPSAELKLATR